ncbi:MAG TPA: hypothetical protein VGZ22_08375 [Isosphaeraceae bacterium]|jgi:hypothetical protein|nr:hypothetical protein [Isosphaeraceae bacterium]
MTMSRDVASCHNVKMQPGSARNRRRSSASYLPRLECLEQRQLLSYNGPKLYGAAYSPTWPNWGTQVAQQLQDSDLFNVAFSGLWGTKNGVGRNDLQAISNSGFNVVRLYNWNPSRQGADGKLDAHLPFLNDAQRLGLKVIVPVSNYFLGNDQYSWRGQVPDPQFSFKSAPHDIQVDLEQFVASITKNGKLDPAVESISIGNEMDLGVDGNPSATAKLQRAQWWVVNLHRVLSEKFKNEVPAHFLTIPISNADQSDVWAAGNSTGDNTATTLNDTQTDPNLPNFHVPWVTNVYSGLSVRIVNGTGTGESAVIASNTDTQLTLSTPWTTLPDTTSRYEIFNPSPVAWFQIFAHGVQANERVPIGTVPDGPAGRFSADVKALGSYPWYNTWFYNSLNMFQSGDQLKNTLIQYDTGQPSGPAWTNKWPNEKLTVPLLITELGTTRFNIGQNAQGTAIVQNQAQVAENVLKTSTNLMGYTIFEFNDEPNKNNYTGGPASEVFFGVTQYNIDQNQFRNGVIDAHLHTGETKRAGGVNPDYVYPVYKLIPVISNGATVLSQLKSVFSQVK